jgi:hypothetical protein
MYRVEKNAEGYESMVGPSIEQMSFLFSDSPEREARNLTIAYDAGRAAVDPAEVERLVVAFENARVKLDRYLNRPLSSDYNTERHGHLEMASNEARAAILAHAARLEQERDSARREESELRRQLSAATKAIATSGDELRVLNDRMRHREDVNCRLIVERDNALQEKAEQGREMERLKGAAELWRADNEKHRDMWFKELAARQEWQQKYAQLVAATSEKE